MTASDESVEIFDVARGPWRAILTGGPMGFVLSDVTRDKAFAILLEDEGDAEDRIQRELGDECSPFEVSVRRGSALPSGEGVNSRLPGSYMTIDLLFEHDVSSLPAREVIARWVQAERVAKALNHYDTFEPVIGMGNSQ